MATLIDDGLAVFALESSRAFGERVAQHLGLPLTAHEERNFEDGEHKARPLVAVRGRDTYVIQSLHGEPGASGNDKLCRLLFFIAALKDAGAARVTAVVPYLAYARKDRQTRQFDPVTTRYVACLFEAIGTDAVMTLDVHNLSAYQNAFRCQTVHLAANGLFIKYLLPLLGDVQVAVVSPDEGGIKRAETFRNGLCAALGRPVAMACAEKYRSEGKVRGGMLIGDVQGRVAVLFDDMISTGTTMAHAAAACRTAGAASVIAVATHGLFTERAIELLGDPLLQRVVVSDSVAPQGGDSEALKAKLAVVSSAALFADAIAQMHGGA